MTSLRIHLSSLSSSRQGSGNMLDSLLGQGQQVTPNTPQLASGGFQMGSRLGFCLPHSPKHNPQSHCQSPAHLLTVTSSLL